MHEPGLAGGLDRSLPRRRVAIALGNALVFAVPGGPQAASGARDELRKRLEPKLEPDLVDIAQLLTSELVTNCVLHGAAATAGSWIDVTASMFPRSLVVEVRDGGPAFHHCPEAPDPEAESGRGLYLIEQLATRWGISGRGSARVWFELAR